MWARLRSWLRSVTSRTRLERDLADEIAFHLQARTDYWIERGLPPADAARRARIEFGGLERHKDDCRQALGLRLLDELRGDLAYGARTLRAAPAFTLVASAILGVAIGGNTAVFNVLETVLFRPLPVARPGELRELAWIQRHDSNWQMSYDGSMRPAANGDRRATSFAYPVYAQVRDRSTAFVDLLLFDRRDITVTVAGSDRRMPALVVSGNFLSGLGVAPLVGRAIEPADDRIGATPVVVLTHGAAHRMFGAEPTAALGQTVSVNGTPAVVVGVTPPAFFGVERGVAIDVLAPITTLLPAIDQGRDELGSFHYWGFRVMGRLRPGVDDVSARAETETLVRQALPPEFDSSERGGLRQVELGPGGQGLDGLRRNYARPLYMLMAIMGAILVIACANVAGLLITRAAAREPEMALRLALGAARGRLIRQLLTESALLASLGSVAGIGLALVVRDALLPLLNQDRDPIAVTFGLDFWLVAFSTALCLAVAVLCGLLPAFRATRAGVAPVLKRTVTGGAASSRLLASKSLIAAQAALSLLLLVAAGLFARTLLNLREQPLGFQPGHLLVFQLDARDSGYRDTRLLDFYERVLDRVTQVPGVRSAGLSRYALLDGGATRDSITASAAPGGSIGVHVHFVSSRYFETMGIPLVAGRDLLSQDREGAPRVAVVNESLARLLGGTAAAVGSRVQYDTQDSDVAIVGLAADARYTSLREPAPPTLYVPYRQYPARRATFSVRVDGAPLAAAGIVRRAIDEIDPHVPWFEVSSQESVIDTSLRQERLFAGAAAGFAGLALLLAALGIYGTVSYAVTTRTREIGIRMALGAERASVVGLVLRESLVPVVGGVAIGLLAAAATTQVLQSMLFGLTPRDVPTMLAATAGLIASALIAVWLPCRRATTVDPMSALRVSE
jgi:predicted permease